MALPLESMVRERLEPYVDDLARSVLSGWRDWQDSTELKRTRYPRTRANIVWEGIQRHARVNLAPHDRIRAVEREQSVAFLCDEQLLLRFKKGDTNGFSRNVPTQLTLSYHDPQQASLLGEVYRIEVVYTLNALNTLVSDILVVARNADSIAWSYSIMPLAGIVPIPLPPAAPSGSPADDVLTPKKPDTPDADTSASDS